MASPVQLPDDILYYNILPRLPFRTLMRLTAVCNAWQNTICRDDTFATVQAQTPSSASVAIARCVGVSLRILSPCSGDVVPRDPFLSFLQAHHRRLSFCACTGGVLCLMERLDPDADDKRRRRMLAGDFAQWVNWMNDPFQVSRRYVSNFFVVNPNPASHRVRRVPYDYEGEVVTAGLAYDPETAPNEGFQLVVPVVEDGGRCRFRRFTSQGAEWSASREAFALPPLEDFKPKPVYASGRVHWVAGDVLISYDLDDDRASTMSLPRDGSGRECDGNHGLGAWRGRLRLARVTTLGVSVWEFTGGGGAGAEGWEMLHSRLWEQVPGLICPRSSWTRVRWKLGTVEMEAGGEEAVCVEVTMEREGDGAARPASSWRGLLRYDVRTGAALSVLKLRDLHEIGPLVDYHSSMAKLPDIKWDRRNHSRRGRKSLWGA